jgi:hypothetical protein
MVASRAANKDSKATDAVPKDKLELYEKLVAAG